MDWILCTTKNPDTHKVKFKDCHGNQFIGNYSIDTDTYYAYGLTRAIDGVIKWMPQDESEDNTPSFTLLDMRAAFKSGQINGFEKCSQGYSKEYFAIFMEREYNIKLPD